ncbi:MAG: MFS transporter [Candidatus Dormibacteraeota bacterium]|nr:MFS transporter [Candidatus Dormibacteraeota bacterium]
MRASRSDDPGEQAAPDSATDGAAPPPNGAAAPDGALTASEPFSVSSHTGSPLVGSALDATERPAPLHASRAAVPPKPEDRTGFLAVLRRRDFRYLWAGQAASQLADKFLVFTLLIFMYTISGRATLQSVLMLAYTVPSVALSAPAGVYADRHDKRSLMIACNAIRGFLVLLIPISQFIPGVQGQAWPLIFIMLLFSSVGQVFAPAEAASIPSLVLRRQMTEATSLFMTTVILTLVLGVPAATLAIAFAGNQAPFYIAAALFGIAALSISRVGTSLRAAERAPDAPPPSLLRELREGLALLRESPALRFGLYQLALALVVVFTVFTLGPVYLVKVLHRSDQDTYFVLVPATVGLVAAAAVLGTRPNLSRARTLLAAVLTAGLALAVMGFVPAVLNSHGLAGLDTPLAVVLALIFGAALGAVLIPAFTLLQERTTPETRGRIFGGIFTVINAAVAVPLVLAGVLADLVGVDRVVAGLGVLLVLIGVGVRTLAWSRLSVLERDSRDSSLAVVGEDPVETP